MYVAWVFIFVVLCGTAGFTLAAHLFGGAAPGILGALAGALAGILLETVARNLRRLPPRVLVGGLLGLLGGVTVFAVAAAALPPEVRSRPAVLFAQFLTGLTLAYFGASLGAKKGEELSLEDLTSALRPKAADETNFKILDTSVIIDGRIADICETGFLEGMFVIPQFVLRELQYIADSPDALKRNRGRRGLDVLQKIQKKPELQVRITDQDFPKIREVDGKLIELARMMKGKILTNDFNLNKVAELNGVSVLNINQLANALKPVVLPGEVMKVHVLREGKEINQGVGYLDDGTMVVVDNGRGHIGRHVEVSVTSVLQTTAGKMIFSQLSEPGAVQEPVTGAPLGGSGG